MKTLVIPVRRASHCVIPGCCAVRLTMRRVCEQHWQMVPGALRRPLSFQPFTTPIIEQLWDKARSAVEAALAKRKKS